jgi:hypothetical protein
MSKIFVFDIELFEVYFEVKGSLDHLQIKALSTVYLFEKQLLLPLSCNMVKIEIRKVW